MIPTIQVNQNILEMEYAVRGPIPQRAAELKAEGRKIIFCNIGNPQALGQPAMSYYRQVIGLLEDPSKIERERKLKKAFEEISGEKENNNDFIPDDILDLSDDILSKTGLGVGAYTESKGFEFVRKAIADFIDKRDGANAIVKADPQNIFLTNGASEGAKNVLNLLISKESDGIMIPIPQYPLYSATIKMFGGTQVNYFPDEENDWALNRDILEESYQKAVANGTEVKAIVVINPGNPTGAILDEESVHEVIRFAEKYNMAIIADEVYQENLYGKKFTSFAKALGSKNIPLYSLHSISKGFYGECGHRGGYLEVRNGPNVAGSNLKVTDLLLKQASVSLCSNTIGQVLTHLMVSPPQKGSVKEKFLEEKKIVLNNLYEKASIIREAFKKMDGVKVFGETGGMYLFPRLDKLPEGTNDFDYCMALLEETGLCVVNGSGFGLENHLRIAFLPSKEELEDVLPRWIAFHNKYVNQ